RDRVLGDGDAVISNVSNRLLTVASADCTPVLLVDPLSGWFGAVHAGWRGTAARVVSAAIAAMGERGASPQNLLAFFGPSISRDRYEVGPEVIEALRASHANDAV